MLRPDTAVVTVTRGAGMQPLKPTRASAVTLRVTSARTPRRIMRQSLPPAACLNRAARGVSVSTVRVGVAGLGVGVLLAASGCYGSTEPATNIAFDHATLNGHGTMNNGPADVRFDLWETARPSERRSTLPKTVSGGVSGPVSSPNSPFGPYGLVPDTDYSFRLCGRDQGAQADVCAQTRTFRTLKPSGDLLRGFFALQFTGIGHTGNVQAESGPAGGGATGRLQLPGELGNTFDGSVTCLSVHDHDAAVGALGTTVDGTPASGLLKVRDDPTPGFANAGADQVQYTVTPNGRAPNCAAAGFDDVYHVEAAIFTTYDTP